MTKEEQREIIVQQLGSADTTTAFTAIAKMKSLKAEAIPILINAIQGDNQQFE
jgi:hypothetical protein